MGAIIWQRSCDKKEGRGKGCLKEILMGTEK